MSGYTYELFYHKMNGKPTGYFDVVRQPDGEVVFSERTDLADSEKRAKVASRVANLTRRTLSEVERDLVQLAALEERRLAQEREARRKAKESPAPAQAQAMDLDKEANEAKIVRPELFFTKEVAGLTLPLALQQGEVVVPTWILFLQWQDGKREARPLTSSIALPSGEKIFIHPEPGPPELRLCGWSKESRRKWLAGEPCPNPAEVFAKICELLVHYVDFPKEDGPAIVATLATWVFLTYTYPTWTAVPYLHITGPVGSGKTRLAEVLAKIAFRPCWTSSVTPAYLFRSAHHYGGSYFFDEMENWNTRDSVVSELLSILLAGYRQGGTACRLEPTADGGFRTIAFDCFSPKVIISIGSLPSALASRTIVIRMLRSPTESPRPSRLLDSRNEDFQKVKDALHAIALECGGEVQELANRPSALSGLAGRNAELWRPLIGLAGWLEGYGAEGLEELLHEFALRASEATTEEAIPEADGVLLKLLMEALRSGRRPSPRELLGQAQAENPVLFKTWTPKAVSSRLKRYGLSTRKHSGTKVYDWDCLSQLQEVQTRYGLDLGDGGDTPPTTYPNVPQRTLSAPPQEG